MSPSQPLFLPLRPPPGGLARLRERVEQPADFRRPWRLGAIGTTAAAALALAWLLAAPSPQQQETRRLTRALQAAAAPTQPDIRVERGAALALPSAQADVRIYLVQTAPR